MVDNTYSVTMSAILTGSSPTSCKVGFRPLNDKMLEKKDERATVCLRRPRLAVLPCPPRRPSYSKHLCRHPGHPSKPPPPPHQILSSANTPTPTVNSILEVRLLRGGVAHTILSGSIPVREETKVGGTHRVSFPLSRVSPNPIGKSQTLHCHSNPEPSLLRRTIQAIPRCRARSSPSRSV